MKDMKRKHLIIQSVLFDCVNCEITVTFNNTHHVRIVRQFFDYELVGGTDEMRELAEPIAAKFNTFLQGSKL